LASAAFRSLRAETRDGALSLFGWAAAALFVALILTAIAAIVAHATPAKVAAALTSENARAALLLSIKTTSIAALLIVVAGTPLALALTRSFPGRGVLEVLVTMPVVMPPVVAGLALLLAFGRMGLLGSALHAFGVSLPFTTAAVVLAQLFVAGPLYVIAAANALASVDADVVDAAATLRASFAYTALRVILPPALPALGAALALAWARALGEFGATIMFAGNLPGVTQTMPIAVYVDGQTDVGTAIALSFVLLVVSFVVLFIARALGARASLA
jgi:molybdate transport system permease protein